MLLCVCNRFGSPIFVHLWVWLLVVLLYGLDITGYTEYGSDRLMSMIAVIILPFMVGYLCVRLIFNRNKSVHERNLSFDVFDVVLIESKVDNIFKLFLLFVVFEFIFEGYVPLISMLNGSDVSHFEFGIASLHGFLLALGAILGTCYYLLHVFTKKRKSLVKIYLIFFIFILLVTRKMMVVLAVQIFMIELLLFGMRNIKKYIIYGLGVVLVFGFIGDVRIDREKFLSLANLNYHYPDFLPSGFIWIYIYMITPLANLLNLVFETNVHHTWLPNFMMSLFPTVIRINVFGESVDRGGSFSQDWLVSEAFNVSTGYAGIYVDYSFYGLIAFGVGLGWISGYLWGVKKGIGSLLACVVINYCLVSMIFSCDFFNLNVIFQLVLIKIIFGNRMGV